MSTETLIEGDGIAKPIKPIVKAWTLEINGEVDLSMMVNSRRLARSDRNFASSVLPKSKVHVRRVIITPTKGR